MYDLKKYYGKTEYTKGFKNPLNQLELSDNDCHKIRFSIKEKKSIKISVI